MHDKDKRRVTLFDFDGTLIACDSFPEFAVEAVGKLRFIQAFAACAMRLCAWKLGLIDGTDAKMHLFRRLYRGMSYAAFKKSGEEFSAVIDGNLRQDIFAAFMDSVRRGDTVYIISASVVEWIEPWASKFPGVKVLSTRIEVRDGVLTGELASANCKGVEKLKRLRELEPELSGCYVTVYSDNKSDKPLMEIADEAFMV